MINIVCDTCLKYGLVARQFPEDARKGYPENPKVYYPFCSEFGRALPYTFQAWVQDEDTPIILAGKDMRCEKELDEG